LLFITPFTLAFKRGAGYNENMLDTMKMSIKRAMLTAFVLLGLVLGLAAGCAPTSSAGTPNPSKETPAPSAKSILSEAVEKLKAARSYRFEITATHKWVFEGKEQNWEFQGDGAFVSPNRFRSQLEGPADTFFLVEINGDKVEAGDARGNVQDASTAFGGPGFGTAPYTVIAYLKNSKEATDQGTTSLSGAQVHKLGFTVDKASISALDAAHAQDMERVTSVQGTVWVDKAEQVINQETVKVEFFSRSGQKETVTITLRFFDFNKPVGF